VCPLIAINKHPKVQRKSREKKLERFKLCCDENPFPFGVQFDICGNSGGKRPKNRTRKGNRGGVAKESVLRKEPESAGKEKRRRGG